MSPAPLAPGATFDPGELGDWYSPTLLGAATLGEFARDSECLEAAERVTASLSEDAYASYMLAFYQAGAARFGVHWGFADISTVLVSASKLARPASYLEIGVRRGRSMAMVSSASPSCSIVGFDMWIEGYAGLKNPGADFVTSELRRIGHEGDVLLVDGDSHVTVPKYLSENPRQFFDLITVDGDHSRDGASADLETVIPRLAIGGVLVFDDIAHPAHPELLGVWEDAMKRHPELSAWQYSDIGYGVALAVRTR